MNSIFNIMFTIIPILVVCIFIFTFAMILSPKLRGKMMSHQIKSLKYMMEESSADLTNLTTTTANAAIKAKKNILDENEDVLRDLATRQANISKDGIETTVRAIKKGFTTESIYCKHCGQAIDHDSKFCKNCGKKQ